MNATHGRQLIAAWALALGVAVGLGAEPAFATTFAVDVEDDEVDADPGDGACLTKSGRCTLRAAIMQANALPGHDVVSMRPGRHRLSLAGRDEDAAASGDLDVTDHLTIEGADSNQPGAQTLVDGGGLDRVFDVAASQALIISRLGIFGGREETGFGGGGIRSEGVLSLTSSRVFSNATATSGGGILSTGVLALESVGIESNQTENGIGGGVAQRGGRARLDNVTLAGNASGFGGGGMAAVEGTTLALNGVTLSQNRASLGGGLDASYSFVTATNVTFSGNSATRGGGLASVNGVVRLLHVTFFGNTAEQAGAISAEETPVWIKNSIVARSFGNSRNCDGPITSEGFNIDSRESCGFTASGDRMTVDPLLGELRNNGGFTRTHAPIGLSGSPTIDTADSSVCPPVDQRGVVRPIDGDREGTRGCDRGAVEVDPRSG